MTITEFKDKASSSNWRDDDGGKIKLKFLPGVDEASIQSIEAKLGAKLPVDLRETIKICSGIEGLLIDVDFTADTYEYGAVASLNRGFGFAHDGFGNYWYVDVLSEQEETSQIFFACHDPAFLDYVYQDISSFFDGALKLTLDPESEFGSARLRAVPDAEPLPYDLALSGDAELSTFANQLGPQYVFVDLRKPGSRTIINDDNIERRTELERHTEQRIFAYIPREKKKGFLSRLFGG